jgi:hypothetical protein
MTSGFSGSPAATASRSDTRRAARSSSTSMRHTVGGAHRVVIGSDASRSSVRAAEKRAVACTNTVAAAFHGANTLLHACFAQPGELMFQCTSPGRRPTQYMVVR